MNIVGNGNATYILLNGIGVSDNIKLSDSVELQTADTSHINLQTTLSACSHPDDIAVAAAFIVGILCPVFKWQFFGQELKACLALLQKSGSELA